MIMPTEPFFWLAVATMAVLSTLGILIAFALIVGRRQIGSERKSLPRFILGIITTFYQPIRIVLRRLRRDDRIVQRIGVDLYNHLAVEAYSAVPAEGRIAVLPHCLRDLKCPAKTDPIAGLLCVKCGRCGIANFVERAERYGIRTYVVNGSSFVKRVVVHFQPEAVFGVACTRDLFEVQHYVNGRGIPMVGTLLQVDGCVSTKVDWDEALALFSRGLPPLEEAAKEAVPETPPLEPIPAEWVAEV